MEIEIQMTSNSEDLETDAIRSITERYNKFVQVFGTQPIIRKDGGIYIYFSEKAQQIHDFVYACANESELIGWLNGAVQVGNGKITRLSPVQRLLTVGHYAPEQTEYGQRDERSFFEKILDGLPDSPYDGTRRLWSDGERVLAKSEDAVNTIADCLEVLGESAVTGYYDPEEDKRNDEVDGHSGYYYVEL